MNSSLRILGVWSAAAFFLLWLVGFVFFAQWIPPIPPSASADQIAELFRARSVPIRIGMVLMTIGTVFYLPWSMVLSDLIKEIEGTSFFLAGTPLAAGVVSAMTFFLPAFPLDHGCLPPATKSGNHSSARRPRLVVLHHSDRTLHPPIRDPGDRHLPRQTTSPRLSPLGGVSSTVGESLLSGHRRDVSEDWPLRLERVAGVVDPVRHVHRLVRVDDHAHVASSPTGQPTSRNWLRSYAVGAYNVRQTTVVIPVQPVINISAGARQLVQSTFDHPGQPRRDDPHVNLSGDKARFLLTAEPNAQVLGPARHHAVNCARTRGS